MWKRTGHALCPRSPLLWTFGIVFCLFGLYVAVCNWGCLLLNRRNARAGIDRRYSQGPVVGPISLLLGLQALPIEHPRWIWLLLLVDPSTVIVAAGIPFLFREVHRARQRDRAASTRRVETIRDRWSRLLKGVSQLPGEIWRLFQTRRQ